MHCCSSRGHLSKCSMVCGSVPHSQVTSSVSRYPHFLRVTFERPTPDLNLLRHFHSAQLESAPIPSCASRVEMAFRDSSTPSSTGTPSPANSYGGTGSGPKGAGKSGKPPRRREQRRERLARNWGEREDARDQWQEHQQRAQSGVTTPTTTKSSHAHTSDGPDFCPGEFPMVFKATAGLDDTVEVPVVPDASTAYQNVANVLSSLAEQDRLVQYRAQANLADPNAWERFLNLFEAAGLACVAQNILKTQTEAKRPIGRLSYLNRTQIEHLRCIRVIAGQYGIVNDTELGRWLTLPGFEQFIQKVLRGIVRLAEAPPGLRPRVVARTAGCIWLPITDVDRSLDQFLQAKLQRWSRSRGHDWLKVSDTLPILLGSR